ncbi:hypothetical protein UlMin_040596 [Ulmus minor]
MADIPKPVASKEPKGEWSTGLFGCLDDCSVCCLTCLCPCVVAGRIAEIVDRGNTSCGSSGTLYMFLCCLFRRGPWLYSCGYRTKLRHQYMLKETCCNDCCVHVFCHECAMCQEYRELQNRGFNMAAGWHANMQTQAPIVHGGMDR